MKKLLADAVEEAVRYARAGQCSGKVANYIPELANADGSMVGLSVYSMDGKMFAAGDWQARFTMQSISKLISLILALQTSGYDKVFEKVGVEPTGDPFNSIARLETKTRFPLNPMINAGAIVVASMIDDPDPFGRFMELTRKMCGRKDIEVNERVFASEMSAGMRNRAIAYYLVSEKVLEDDPEAVVDRYFRMCSVEACSADLARFAAVLANDGLDIETGERIAESWIMRIIKTLMVTCGMYDGSGEFAVRVGMPAKSGVGGGIIAVAERKLGICAYSPALDKKGNSVRGVRALEYLSDALKLHCFAGGEVEILE